MTKWKKTDIKLKPNHGWRAAPGHKLLIIDRGDFQFEYPNNWHVTPDESGSIKVTDKPIPNDDCVLQVSLMRFPPLDESRPSLAMLIQQSAMAQGEMIESEDIHTHPRQDVEIVWGELRRLDLKHNRQAIWHHCFCHTPTEHGHLMALATFGYWPSDADRMLPVWNHFLETLIMNRPVADPSKGPQFH